MLTFGQRLLRGEGPGSFLIHHHLTDDLAIVDDADRVARRAHTGQGRLVVVSDATVADGPRYRALVIHRARHTPASGSSGINGHYKAFGFRRMRAILVDHHRAKNVLTFP